MILYIPFVGRRGIKKRLLMKDTYHYSVDMLLKEIEEISNLGIKSILFGIPNKKDEVGTEAYSEQGIIQKAVREIKKFSLKCI